MGGPDTEPYLEFDKNGILKDSLNSDGSLKEEFLNLPTTWDMTFLESRVEEEEVTFPITLAGFSMNPESIVAYKGQKITLEVTARNLDYRFRLPAFKIDREIEKGETVKLTFEGDRVGVFEFEVFVKYKPPFGGFLIVDKTKKK